MTDDEWVSLSLTISLIFLGLLFVYGVRVEGWHMLDTIALVP